MIYEEKKNTHRVAYTSFVFGGKLFNGYFLFIYEKSTYFLCLEIGCFLKVN